ncbi:CHRD domain-containing protein [Xylophilus sp. GW821-FHT01B05]
MSFLLSSPRRRACAALASVAVLALASGCVAWKTSSSPVTLGATLTGAAEVPPVQSSGTGTLQAWYSKETGSLRWRLTYTGLSGAATAAHFHGPAAVGANAGVLVPIGAPYTGSQEGVSAITPAQASDLLAGRWYVNVHTQQHPGGEIRGQVTVQ